LVSPLSRNRELYRAALLKLLEHAPESLIALIGAGPLEDFISDDESDLQWLEANAATNERLRSALSMVWVWRRVTPATLSRLEAAARVPLDRPDR